MKTTWVIARREMSDYFMSPVAYAIMAAFVALSGFLFFSQFFVQRVAQMDGFFNNLPLVFLFFAPAMAMRAVAEERGTGTLELLLTLPVRDRDVIFGKYIAILAVLAVALVATLPFVITVSVLGDLALGPVFGGYLGAFLLGALYLSAGVFASSITKSQVIAFLAGLIVCFGIFALTWFVDPGSDTGAAVQYASPKFHYGSLTRGHIDLRSLIYFGSGIALFVTLSIQALEARKWR